MDSLILRVILCAARPGSLANGGFAARTGSFVTVLDRGAWDLGRLD